MKWNKRYKYPPSTRSLIEGSRHYDISNEILPSVTTILQATQSDEKKASLAKWRQKVGENEAEKIRDEAATRGTAMHEFLEMHLRGNKLLDLSDEGQVASGMGQVIIDQGLKDMEEVWGSEVTLFYPGLYAGSTDLCGIYSGRESIVDFKQTNKPKKREWIDDYFIQLGAYAMAHNYIYRTKIQSGVILMCSKDGFFQKFEVADKEFVHYQHAFLKKVDQYYRDQKQNPNEKDTKNDHIGQ